MNYQKLLDRIQELESNTLNRIRIMSILSFTLVFGVVLYNGVFNQSPLPQQLASAYQSDELFIDDKEKEVVIEEDDFAVGVVVDSPEPELVPVIITELEEVSLNTKVVVDDEQVEEKIDDTFSARAIIITDMHAQDVLQQKNSGIPFPPASLTKIMTAVVVAEHIDASEVISITQSAIQTESAAGRLRPGEKFTVSDLMRVMLIVSSNDAAVAFEEYFSSKGLNLVSLMNVKAKEIGMENTHFDNVTGLDDNEHYASAYDLALLVAHSFHHQEIWDILSTKVDTVESINESISHHLISTNELLQRGVPEMIGGKTGYTSNALGCMISKVEVAGEEKIIVVLGSENRFGETEKLIEIISNQS